MGMEKINNEIIDKIADETYENRISQVIILYNEFIDKINNDNSISGYISVDDVKNACIGEYTTTGRVKNITVGNVKISAEKLRVIFGLKSTNFELENKDEKLIFNVLGYGHGVGMSQVGANTYANKGMKYDEIIKHYYKGVEIINLE